MRDKIKIGGITYKILKQSDCEIDGDMGRAWTKKAFIKINSDMPEDVQKESLLHECLHVILENIGRDDLSGDEQLVHSLSAFLFQVLNDYNFMEVYNEKN